jgi:[glutamine synthetase] adenylyltransferase / [glutamine synthetase]-adenylyl-L-tyrosine phosphorylase
MWPRTLTDHYRAHREVEHRLQMVNDAQTHMPAALPRRASPVSPLHGHGTGAPSATDLKARIAEVHDLTEGFFAPGRGGRRPT